jgi:hypothetical protein
MMTRPQTGGEFQPLAEINVTPLVDVMLVLLIVFMVAAPLVMSGVELQLPKSAPHRWKPQKRSSSSSPPTAAASGEKPWRIAISRQVGGDEGPRRRHRLCRGDRAVPYGRIMGDHGHRRADSTTCR